MRPGQLILMLDARATAVAAERQHEQLAGDDERDRPARQQREVPAHHHPGDDQQPVDDRVQQRPQPAVLAGEPGGEPVQVVGPPDHREQDRRRRGVAVAAGERQDEEHRDARQPGEADRVRDRPRVQRLV